MSPRTLLAVAALVTAVAVAACGSSTVSPSPSPSEPASSAPASSAPASSAPASSAPSPTVSGDVPTALPTFTRVPELEALLPATVDGVVMQIVSLTGDNVVVGGIDSNQADLTAFLDALGKQPTDLAFAFSADPKRVLPILIGVYVVKGVDGAAIGTVLVDHVLATDPATKKTQETIGGKQATVLERTDPANGATTIEAFYANGDRLYRVSAPTRTYVADGLALVE